MAVSVRVGRAPFAVEDHREFTKEFAMPRKGLSAALPIVATAAALIGWAATDATAATMPSSATQVVSYQGLHFTVPASWPVVNVTPTTCVRFDRHVVYLGAPGANQDCPASVVGRTEALLVQPDSGTATATTENAVAHEITATASGVRVTATYAHDETTVRQILASAALPAPSAATATPKALRPFASSTTLSTEYTGGGFDTCTAPSSATMNAWLASPYRSVGIFIGGSDMGCSQANLTASWVSQQVAAGWHFQPMYVGPQASAGEITSPTSQAVAAADDAANQAGALGFGSGSLLYYDMEAYPPAQSSAAVAFMSAWTTELHAKGYQSGIYSSMASGVADLINNVGNSNFTEPDVLFFAHIPGSGASTNDSVVPAADWANHQRAHQYALNSVETYGNVQLTVDDDYLDVELACNGPTGSVLARNSIGFCGWTVESSPGMRGIAVGSDGTQMVLGGDGTVYAKNSVGAFGWTVESSPGMQAVATDDGVQMVLGGDGTVYAKNSIGLYGWTVESSPGMRGIAVGSDGTQMVLGGDGTVYAKNSIGLYGWTVESSPGMRTIATSDGVQMVLGGDGTVYAKNSIGLYGWTVESSPGMRAIAVGSDDTQMIIGGDGDVYAKNTIGLFNWTREADQSQAIATSGGVQMIIFADGAVYAKNGIGLYGWTKESDPPARSIAVGSTGVQMIVPS